MRVQSFMFLLGRALLQQLVIYERKYWIKITRVYLDSYP